MTGQTAIYKRISDDKTGLAEGVGNQHDACMDMCHRNGWADPRLYEDNDVSATKGRPREHYNRLMRDVQAGLVDRIVVFHLSRLWRNRRERADGIEILRQRGVSVICTKGPTIDMSTAYGRGMAAMLGEVDTMEVELKSERQQLANAAILKAGRPHPGGPRPFGYEPKGAEVRESERTYVERAFEMWVTGGTLGHICRWLRNEGVNTTKGNTWTSGSMKRMLSNPRYAGLRGIRPLLYGSDGKPLLDEHGDQRRSDWYEVVTKGTWPAIVDEETWRAAVHRLRHPSRMTGRPNLGRKHLGAGLFRCAVCEAILKCHTNNQQRSFRCPTLGHVTRKAEPIEDFVRDVVLERLRQPDAMDLLRTRQPVVDVRGLHDERDAIRGRLRAFAQDEVLGRRTRDEVLAAREVASARLAEIDRALTEVGKVDVVAKFLGAGVDPLVVWNDPETSLKERQGLVDSLAVVRVGSGRNGRPPKYTDTAPPPNVIVDWR